MTSNFVTSLYHGSSDAIIPGKTASALKAANYYYDQTPQAGGWYASDGVPVGGYTGGRPAAVSGAGYSGDPAPYAAVEVNDSSRSTKNQEKWSWTIMIWNIIGIVLCPSCIACMLTGLICNVMAYTDHKTGDLAGKQYKLRCSFWWTVGTLVFALVSLVILFIVLFGIEKAQDWTSSPFGLATD